MDDGALLITGGIENESIISILDIEGNYEEIAKILGQHYSHVAILVNGAIYLISGKNSNDILTPFCEVLDLVKP